MIRCVLKIMCMTAALTGMVAVPQSHAGKLSISPVMATLSENQRINSLLLKNESPQLITVQVKLYAWQQDENGADLLTPSEALSYMPRIFQIKPGEERSVRIGYSGKKPFTTEQAYRLYLTEQPQATVDPAEKGQLKVALSMGIPVFVSPNETERDKGSITSVTAAKRNAEYVVENTGNGRLVMKSVMLTGHDDSGATVFSIDLGRQFVLAATKKRFSAQLPAETCGKTTSIQITGKLESTGTVTATLPLPAAACKE